MRYLTFGEKNEDLRIAVLIKESAFNEEAIYENYIKPLETFGIQKEQILAMTLSYDEHGKIPVKHAKAYLEELLPAIRDVGIKHILVADSTYFKLLGKVSKADPHLGYVLPCAIKNFEDFQIALSINYQALIYNPQLKAKLLLGVTALANHFKNQYTELGEDIFKNVTLYDGTSPSDIILAIKDLHKHPELTCDIEAFSLIFHKAGIGTISFAWDKHSGIAFPCDYCAVSDYTVRSQKGYYYPNAIIREALLEFFSTYKGKITWHNAAYDVKVIIYTLYMKLFTNTFGLLKGLDVFTKNNNFDDTKIIAYLATNSTAGNELGLKALAHEFAGNWAKDDIKDIRQIPLDDLLKYNMTDALSTWYVKDKYTPIMIQDQQEQIYQEIMLPSLRTIIQMELTGMPMDKKEVGNAKFQLESLANTAVDKINKAPVIQAMNCLLQNTLMEKANAKLKTKQHDIDHFKDSVFNPNSGPQLQQLLYQILKLPVLDYTDKKQPATGADTIEKLIHHTNDKDTKELLTAIIDYGKTNKILTTFIPAFEQAVNKSYSATSPCVFLFGNFNLGGTVSGRLSSSGPNLQNIPSGSVFGKLVKQCFQAPPGWLFVGADFSSLEDKISALTTKDPNKIKVYTDKFDGHCLRASSYFAEDMPDISKELLLKPTERVFKIKREDGSLYYAKGSDIMQSSGKTVEQTYDSNTGI